MKFLTSTAIAVSLFAMAGCAQAQSPSSTDRAQIDKELPILDGRTKTSRNAAKAALAAHKQGKYLEMHTALMEASGLTPDRIKVIAKDVGVDVAKLERDMNDPEIDALLEDTLILANRIPALTGTPFFIINDMMIAGADTDRLQASLEAALEG